MIIVIDKADFSANAIGKVDLPVTVGSYVQGMMSNYSAYNTEANRTCLQRFYNSCKPFWSNIKAMLLPMFATKGSEAWLDVINGKYVCGIESSADTYTLIASDRSAYVSGQTSGSQVASSGSYFSNVNNAGTCFALAYKTSFSGAFFNIVIKNNLSGIGSMPDNSVDKALVVAINDSGDKVSLCGDSNTFNWFAQSVVNGSYPLNIFYPFGRSSDTALTSGLTACVIANGLTDAQMVKLKDALAELNNNFS